jgi:hypothetical protein
MIKALHNNRGLNNMEDKKVEKVSKPIFKFESNEGEQMMYLFTGLGLAFFLILVGMAILKLSGWVF